VKEEVVVDIQAAFKAYVAGKKGISDQIRQ
jgi:hypothetical protein